ncbi:3' exoribonuclease family, domain 1 [Ostertagia ostertagi]
MSSTGRLRMMRCELGYIRRADGSCSYSQGRTSLWASCSGPGDIHIARREDEQMHLDVSFRQLTGDCQYHELNNIIQSTLESVLDLKMFPRTGLTVTVHLLQDDGSIGGAALTAAGLAVLDNGISIRAPFCGVEVCQVDGKLVLDADARTQARAEAKWLFAFTRTADVSDF